MSAKSNMILSVPSAPLFRILKVSLSVNGFDIIDSTQSENHISCRIGSKEHLIEEEISLELFGFGSMTIVSIQDNDGKMDIYPLKGKNRRLGRNLIYNMFRQIDNEYVRSTKIRATQ